jgi:acetyl-CoA acetyltransferase
MKGAAFHRRYMLAPIDVKDASGRKVIATVKDDEGIFPTTREGLAKLKPVLDSAGIATGDVTAIKTHNPFAVNDIYFTEQLGVKPEAVTRKALRACCS